MFSFSRIPTPEKEDAPPIIDWRGTEVRKPDSNNLRETCVYR